ncbi:MAG: hypothetical protein ACE5GF_03165 [Thermodesulfobacteriota bacterium]
MSIIHEALKKIEADRGDGASAFISQSPGRGRKGSPYLRLILLIFVLFFAAGATILYKDHLNMEEGKTLRQPGEKMRGKIEGGLSPSPESSKQENVGFKDARERNLKGIALFNAGNVKGAIEEFRAAVNQSPPMRRHTTTLDRR